MSSCFGFRKTRRDDEHEPLLPDYQDETALQRRLHQKLHTYQMYRAIASGYMPSTEQTVVNLRTLIASDVLNPDPSDLSDSGRLLAKYTKQWLKELIDLLLHKCRDDQLQDCIWFLTKSRITLDARHIQNKASAAKTRADAVAAFRSIQTVGSLLLTNSDFRVFLSDLQVVGREVFRDSALAVSQAAENAGKQVDPAPGEDDVAPVQKADKGEAPSTAELGQDQKDVAQVVAGEASEVGKEVSRSVATHFSGDERQILMNRLRSAVVNLRQRKDYSESVSTIALLIKRYALAYSRAAEQTAQAAEDSVQTNDELDYALKEMWSFVTSFGSKEEWQKLERLFQDLLEHHRSNPDLEKFMNDIGNTLHEVLSQPEQLQNVDSIVARLRQEAGEVAGESSIRQDFDSFLEQTQRTCKSVMEDGDIAALVDTSSKILNIVSPAHSVANQDLLHDALHTMLPLLIQGIQYIPIPRLEVSTPDIDLLLENVILEPGKTVNQTSFLPFRFNAQNTNEVEIRRTHTLRTTATTSTHITLKIDGLTVRAEELGYWLRLHANPILRFTDSGIASFALDKRGIDIHLDLELVTPGPDNRHLDQVVHLRAVRVQIHKLNYALRSSSKFSCLAWFFGPILRPILRRTLEKQLASAIEESLHALNRELVFARERLRATRIADPDDLLTFFRAVAARLTPEEDPDLYTRVGVDQPGQGVFKGRYAPGSVVKLWHEEAAQAAERIDDGRFERGGWRNAVFDVPTASTVEEQLI